jgi:heparinase II/III-like protein
MREVGWRAARRWRSRQLERLLESRPAQSIRNVPYYRPTVESVSAEQKQILVKLADGICQGRIPFLSYGTRELGLSLAWSTDFVSGREWPMGPSHALPVMRSDGSDIKVPWELSRLQFLTILGKAHYLTREPAYRKMALHFVDDWIQHNPAGQGVNWIVAMEVAIRALNILLLLNLLWPLSDQEKEWEGRVATSLWQHLTYIEANLEFSHIVRGNHYLSNLAGLYGLAVFLDGPGMRQRRRRYQRLLEREILFHTYDDGGNYEASSGYHVLVTQIFFTAYQLMRADGAAPSRSFVERLQKMFEWIEALADSQGRLPHIGDCDDGRVEFLFDDLRQMAGVPLEKRNSLRVSSLIALRSVFSDQEPSARSEDGPWFGFEGGAASRTQQAAQPGELQTTLLPASGIAVMRRCQADLFFLALPNGIAGKGSHTHNDKLSVVFHLEGEEVLCDPGTGCYTRDIVSRNHFRSTGAHNTIVVDEQEQNRISALPIGLFSLDNDARVSPLHHHAQGRFSAEHNGYASLGVRHRRTVEWRHPRQIELEDTLDGSGRHRIELCFQLGPEIVISAVQAEGSQARCVLQGKRRVTLSMRGGSELRIAAKPSLLSRIYGTITPAWKVSVTMDATLPTSLVTTVSWDE